MFESIEILAESDEGLEGMRETSERLGVEVRKETVWRGITPPNSYIDMGLFRMARPEYLLFRKANELDEGDAVKLAVNLLLPIETRATWSCLEDGETKLRDEPHITRASFVEYLAPVYEEPEAIVAMNVLTKAMCEIEEMYKRRFAS